MLLSDSRFFAYEGADKARGAFLPPLLLHCGNRVRATNVHSIEAFGPVCTVMGYNGMDEAIQLADRGGGSLVASVYTHYASTGAELVFGIGHVSWPLILIDRGAARGNGDRPRAHRCHTADGSAGVPGVPAAAKN